MRATPRVSGIFVVNQLIEDTEITQRICIVRGMKVMLDRDLAELYGAEASV